MQITEYNSQIQKSKKPVIVYITAPWCMPCKMMGPTLENVRNDFQAQVEFIKINADDAPPLLQTLSVSSVPTLIGYRGGVEFTRRSGLQTAGQLRRLYQSLLQDQVSKRGITSLERLLRAGAGIALMLVGWLSLNSLLLIVLGGLLAFSAVWDRCPIAQAVKQSLLNAWTKIKQK